MALCLLSLALRKPVWARLQATALDQLLLERYTPIPTATAKDMLLARQLGIAKIRLLPKRSGMRPITLLGCESVVTFKGGCSSRAGGGGSGGRGGGGGATAGAGAGAGRGMRHPSSAAGAGGGVGRDSGGNGRGSARPIAAAGGRGVAGRGAAGRGFGGVLPRVPGGGVRKRQHYQQQQGGSNKQPLRLQFRSVNMVLQPAFQVRRLTVDGCSVRQCKRSLSALDSVIRG